MLRIVLSGVLAVLAAAIAACGSSAAPSPAKPAAAAPAPPPPTVPAARPTFPGAPATPSGGQLAWVLDVIIARHGKVDRPEVESHFHASFLAQLPVDQVIKTFAQLGGQLTGLTLTGVQGDDDQLVAQAALGGAKLQISLAVDPASKRIVALQLQPREAAPQLPSFDEALRAIAALAPRAQFQVAALDGGTCRPLHELAATEPLAIGSTFKLYVLLALADRILAGKAAWTDEVAVRDDWKSLPSGITQNEPPGKKHPLATLAERMISLSDNTAADHLLYTLGRKEVEAAVRASRHAKPALDVPFLSSREVFIFRLGLPPAEIARYLKLPEARRRDFLDRTLAGKDPNIGLASEWKVARQIDKIEWFASSTDLCRAMAALWTRGQDPRTKQVLDILAKRPGLPLDKERWPYIGYKGGQEPGVLNMTFLLKRSDDKWFVATFGFNATEGGTLEDTKILKTVAAVIELLGAESTP